VHFLSFITACEFVEVEARANGDGAVCNVIVMCRLSEMKKVISSRIVRTIRVSCVFFSNENRHNVAWHENFTTLPRRNGRGAVVV